MTKLFILLILLVVSCKLEKQSEIIISDMYHYDKFEVGNAYRITFKDLNLVKSVLFPSKQLYKYKFSDSVYLSLKFTHNILIHDEWNTYWLDNYTPNYNKLAKNEVLKYFNNNIIKIKFEFGELFIELFNIKGKSIREYLNNDFNNFYKTIEITSYKPSIISFNEKGEFTPEIQLSNGLNLVATTNVNNCKYVKIIKTISSIEPTYLSLLANKESFMKILKPNDIINIYNCNTEKDNEMYLESQFKLSSSFRDNENGGDCGLGPLKNHFECIYTK